MTPLPRLRVGLLTPALGLLLAAGAHAQRLALHSAPAQPAAAAAQQLSAQQAQDAAEQQPPAEPPPGICSASKAARVLERDARPATRFPACRC